ncbi:MAG TPA: Ig-like domain-containing protein [Nakamurella sp.]
MTRVRGVGVALIVALLTVVTACSTPGSSGSVLGTLGDTAGPGATVSGDPSGAGAPSTVTAASTTSSSTPPPPPPLAEVTASPANGTGGADPLAPVSVAVVKGTLESVRMTNPEGVEIPGTLAADKLSWIAQTELGYGKTYTITSSARSTFGVIAETTSTFTTVVPNNKTKAFSFPSDGMTVGVAQPISIHFDEPVPDRAAALQAITVTTTPAQTGGFRWIDDQEVRWRPAEFWQPGSTAAVTVDIYGKDLGGGLYGQEDLTFGFTVGRSLIAEIDDNTHTMVVKQDGQVINEVPVSLGRDKYPTYNGIHVVSEKYENKLMDSSTWGLTGAGAYRTDVQWATRISNSGEFVHAAPWSVGSQGYENVSHGCVNVSTDAAKWFYDTFLPGDPVIIRNTVGPDLEVWDGYGDFQLPFDQYVQRA